MRRSLIAAFGAGLLLGAARLAAAHDIPARVAVLAFLKPEGRLLRVAVRVPLEAMRDINYPVRGIYLDLGRAEPLLFDAANVWVAGSIRLTEDGRELQDARIASLRISLPSDRSFADYQTALAHLRGPKLPDATDLVWQQGMLDVLLE
jgi:hypothetical protein